MNSTSELLAAMDWESRDYFIESMPRLLITVGDLTRLTDLLSELPFIQAKLRTMGTGALVSDYVLAADSSLSKGGALLQIANALQRAAHVLDDDPEQLAAQLLVRTAPTTDPTLLSLLQQATQWRDHSWLRPLLPSLLQSEGLMLKTLAGHNHSVLSVAIDAAGTIVASGATYGSLIVWDLETGRPQHILAGHQEAVTSVALTHDGQWLVSASEDSTVRVWDSRTGVQRVAYPGHTTWVNAVAVAENKQLVISGDGSPQDQEGVIRVWQLHTGADVRELSGHRFPIRALATSHSGKFLASGDDNGFGKVWNLETGDEICAFQHQSRITAVAFTSDGRRVISTGQDCTLRAWDAASGQEFYKIDVDGWPLAALVVLSDDRHVLAGSTSGDLMIVDLDHDETTAYVGNHNPAITGVAASRYGRYVVSASEDYTLRVWDPSVLLSNGEPWVLRHHTEPVTAVAISDDSRCAISRAESPGASSDGKLIIWATAPDNQESRSYGPGQVHTLPIGTQAYIRGIWRNGDGLETVSRSADGGIRVWDATNGTCLRTIGTPRNGTAVHHPDQTWALTPNSAFVVTYGTPGSETRQAFPPTVISVWELSSGAEALRLTGFHSEIEQLSVSPDAAWVVAAAHDRRLHLWDLRTGTLVHTFEAGPLEWRGVAVAPGGFRLLATGGKDASHDTSLASHSIRLWTLSPLERTIHYHDLSGHTGPVNSLDVSADGRYAVSASDDTTVIVWDLASHTRIKTLEGHTGPVDAVAVSANARYTVSASFDRTVRLWAMKDGELIATFVGESPMRSCAMAGDPPIIVAGDASGQVHLLKLELPEVGSGGNCFVASSKN